MHGKDAIEIGSPITEQALRIILERGGEAEMADEQKMPIPAKIDDVNEFMKERVGVGVSFDVGHRTLIILKKKVEIYYTTGLADAEVVQRVLSKLMSINDDERNTNKVSEIIENRLVHMQVKRQKASMIASISSFQD